VSKVRTGRLTASIAVLGVMVMTYERWLKPWQERWGATDEELALALPGDHLIVEPAAQVTRAITIDAPREEVWPWIVQLGADRAGFYTYDRLENLFGLGIHSADGIVADWQDLEIGQVVYADRARTGGWYVVELRPYEALVLKVADLAAGRPLSRDEKLRWEFLWTFALRDTTDGGTRLLVRTCGVRQRRHQDAHGARQPGEFHHDPGHAARPEVESREGDSAPIPRQQSLTAWTWPLTQAAATSFSDGRR
jgi:hypothetical protein